MKLANKYAMTAATMSELIVTGIRPETYAVGLFLCDLREAGLDGVADSLGVKDFEVDVLEDGAWRVALTAASDDECRELLGLITRNRLEIGARMQLVA